MSKLKFSQLPAMLQYPSKYRAILSTWHSRIIEHTINRYRGSLSDRLYAVGLINLITAKILTNDTISADLDIQGLADLYEISASDDIQDACGDLYVSESDIEWDIEIVSCATDSFTSEQMNRRMTHDTIRSLFDPSTVSVDADQERQSSGAAQTTGIINRVNSQADQPTPKEDLHLRPPTVPAFDKTRPVVFKKIGNTEYCIYTSLPEIPTRQREITVSTDISKLTDSDFMKLYPNRRIQTRASCMYEPIDGMELHPILGLLLPICDYDREQLLDNTLKYPHFYQLRRQVDGTVRSFYEDIEIDGELHRTLDVWDQLDDSSRIPKTSEFIKEYVIRRYLLERDVKHIKHKYPLDGTMDPFITLCLPADDYKEFGYRDPVALMRRCVLARYAHIRSRNPILKAVGLA